MATQVVSRIRNGFDLELPLRAIFEHPTIAGLATKIERGRGNTDGREQVNVLLTELESISDP